MFSSLTGGDELSIPANLGNSKGNTVENFPVDCFSIVLSFISDPKIVFNFLRVSKGVNDYIQKNGKCFLEAVEFVLTSNHPPKTPQNYVTRLKYEDNSKKIGAESSTKNRLKMFKNVKYLKLKDVGSFGGEIFQDLNKIEKLTLEDCPNFNENGFQSIKDSLRKLIIDNSRSMYRWDNYKISRDIFKNTPNLEHLEIHGYFCDCSIYEGLLDLSKIKTFRTNYGEVSSRVLKVWNDLRVLELRGVRSFNAKRFKYAKKLESLRIYDCRRMTQGQIKKNLKPFPKDYEFQEPRPRKGKIMMPPPMSDSDEEEKTI